jgi:putative peptide zinc metalloprotease protein
MASLPVRLVPARSEAPSRTRDRAAGGEAVGVHPEFETSRDDIERAPARAEGVEMLGMVRGSGYRTPPSLVRRADGQTIQLTPLLYGVLEAIDGRRSYEEIAADLSERISRGADVEDVRYLIDEKLRPFGLLLRPDGSEPVVKKMNPLLALRLRAVITNPTVTARLTAPFAAFFHPAIVMPFVLAFAAVSGWVFFEKGLAGPLHDALYQPGRLLLVFGLMIVSAGFHEFGHAAAARYAGVRPGAMGVGLYLVWPVFYTDVTDAYRLGRRDRLRVDLGGLYFNAIFAVATLGAWAATSWDALLLLVPIQVAHMLRQLLPFVRFDGYHILADLTGVPDLFAHIKPTLLRLIPRRRRTRQPGALRPVAAAIVTLWVVIVVPLLASMLIAIVAVFPRLAATAWDSAGARWEIVRANWQSGSTSEVAVGLLSIAMVVLPVLGITYLMVRVTRRAAQGTWRATTGRPVIRTLSIAAAIAGIALLIASWWPNGQYRPIQANEQGSVIASAPATTPPASPQIELTTSTEVPANASTQLAFILTPQNVPDAEPIIIGIPSEDSTPPGDAQGWVFPFDPPGSPGEGDNQALAVNTVDGSTVYDVSIGVVWVTGNVVDNVNEAWAVASCTACTTVAVAYQVLYVLDDPAYVVPQNIAVAVNYECVACQTVALSGQLVVTLTNYPSPEAIAELAALSADLEAVEANVQSMSLDDVYAELNRIEAEIVQVLIDDGVLEISETVLVEASVTPAASPAPAIVPEPSPTQDPSPTTEATTSPAPTETTSPAPSETTSPAPSETTSPSASESPSPDPTESATPAP